ncbi:NAD-dependent epimerase/dehydratase family protein [Nakamurella lactea]|uniref:NAD-dependent epimerase/dehydratase family protein n=1 Tax=Nakamurella lactea TaxID=459515 RepID=UPI000686F19D|nr:NAD-dependent epimerase/dehydratase family protein [Nakamurella lactea]
MKVLVAGATGTLGGRLLPALTEAGHEVIGLARSVQGADVVRARGGRPIVADVMDRDALLSAVSGVRADAVLHELTALKKAPARFRDMDATNRLRTEGSANLLAAAGAIGATRFVTQSIVFGYGYRDVGAVDENTPFGTLAGDPTDAPIRAMVAAEQQAFHTPGIDGIALRYGLFYGDDTPTMVTMLNHRKLPVPTRWRGTLGLIHHQDAATATVAALTRGTPGRAYNIVDDTPASWRDYVDTIASVHSTRPPMALPGWLLRAAAPYAGVLMTRVNMQVSNRLARRELGWAPQFPGLAEGLAAAGQARPHRQDGAADQDQG